MNNASSTKKKKKTKKNVATAFNTSTQVPLPTVSDGCLQWCPAVKDAAFAAGVVAQHTSSGVNAGVYGLSLPHTIDRNSLHDRCQDVALTPVMRTQAPRWKLLGNEHKFYISFYSWHPNIKCLYVM